jgi:hypothetical protein
MLPTWSPLPKRLSQSLSCSSRTLPVAISAAPGVSFAAGASSYLQPAKARNHAPTLIIPMPSEFNPVILFSDELKQIHAALAKAKHADLVALIEQKTTRSASEQRYLNARQQLDENELDFDDVPIVSEGEDGAYVSCWVWISKERAEELAGAARADARSVEAQAHEAALRRRRLSRRVSRLNPTAKNALIRDLATILYGADLDPQTEWTQDNVEHVADRLDIVLKLRDS